MRPRVRFTMAAPAALFALCALTTVFAGKASAQTTLLSQNFESTNDFTDYYVANNSDNANASNPGWSLPDATTVSTTFSAQSGTSTSYIYADYTAIASGSSGTISTWLITPTLTYQNGDVISFYTRTTGGTTVYPDRLQMRFSSSGTSTDVGTNSAAVGGFATTLLELNPNQDAFSYPIEWTQYSVTLSGLSAPTSGRVAFRYYVTNGGPNGANSNFIGIDTFSVVRPADTVMPEPNTAWLVIGSSLCFLLVVGTIRRRKNDGLNKG